MQWLQLPDYFLSCQLQLSLQAITLQLKWFNVSFCWQGKMLHS